MLYFLNWKYAFFLFMICELVIVAVHMFSQGFLLTRDVLIKTSKCTDYKVPCINRKDKKVCHFPPKFNKVILLVIDALRYDFVTFDKSIKKSQELPYQNKMKIFDDLLTISPKQSKLYKFIADPPTTTMQRLKGLTTGSLPSFIDASHNFASSEITEDNIIDQMREGGKKIIVLGDDTWGKLYPNRFHRSFMFSSFNALDLDTVDNGILKQLFKEIRSSDWNFIIAHFLGVDHCGHTYGPLHTQMEMKLRQMNDAIRNVTEVLTEDTLLIVIGDHGMTQTGNHGGDSKEETETVIFFYSPGLTVTSSPASKQLLSVAQVDLVPTLAFLLGSPIPYSNLGKIIEDIAEASQVSNCSSDHMLFLNYQQVNRYLNSYQELNQEFPFESWEQLMTLSYSINQSTLNINNPKTRQDMVQFLTLAKAMCEEIWAKFNIVHIFLGLISFFCILVSIINILPKKMASSKSIMNNFQHLFVLFLFVNTIYGISLFFFQKELSFIVCLAFSITSVYIFSTVLPYSFDLFSVISLFVISLGSFSNSFVIFEDLSSGFIFLSLIAFMTVNLLHKKLNVNARLLSSLSFSDAFLLGCVIAIFISVRASRVFLKCRQEQHWCNSSLLVHVPLSSLSKEFHNTRYFTSLLSLLAFILIPHRWLQRCGNLNGWEMNVIVAKTFPVLCGLLTGAFWALQSVHSISGNISKLIVHLPQLVYLVMSVGILAFCYNPLLIYTLPSASESILGSSETPVIPQLFRKLKQTYDQRPTNPRKAPIVYGLATSVSAPMVVLLSLVSLSLVLIAGDGMTPGILLLTITATFTLIFHCFVTWNKATSVETLLTPNWCSVALWFLLSLHGFYTTGHQATFSTLNWFSAFVGYNGTGSFVIPATLMVVNTFSSQLLLGISLPLLLVAPLSIGFLWPPIRLKRIEEAGLRGEFILVERHKEAKESILFIAILYIIFHSVKVLMTSVAAFILRRHLMTWAIFAPHFIFEAIGLIVTSFGVLVGLLFTLRVFSSLEHWTKKL